MNIVRKIADGTYTGEIIDITVDEMPDGYPKITWLLRIIGGEHDGDCIEKNFYLKSRGAEDFLQKELLVIGFEIEGAKELMGRKEEIIGVRISFTAQVNNKGYLALYAKGAAAGVVKKAMPEDDEVHYW